MSEGNRPVHTVRVENVNIGIFPRENEKGKSCKDDQGNLQYT